MSFPWITEAQRRRQREEEDLARREVMDLSLRLAGVKPLSTRDTDGMDEILRRQGEVNVLRPASRPFRLPPRRHSSAGERLARFFKTGNPCHE